MRGLKYDFNIADLAISNGAFEVSGSIDNQNIALISLSQVCVLTKPQLGAQIGSILPNAPEYSLAGILNGAKQRAESDGATRVVIRLTADDKLLFTGTYED